MKHLNPRPTMTPKVEKTCKSCGCTFHVLESQSLRGRGIHCSRECSHAFSRRIDMESLKPASFWH